MTGTAARIAIIEDNEDLREELAFFLRAQGHAIWGAGSAEAFWRRLHSDPADIVLVDIGLPGEDGFGVLDHLRGLHRHGTVVITARGRRQDELRGLKLGADFYLVKPINFAQLAQAIAQLWERMQRQDALRPVAASRHWSLTPESLLGPAGEELPLTPQERGLVEILLRHMDEVCDKDQVHGLLFGRHDTADAHRVDVIVSRLRSKARQRGINLPIRTVFGKGFVFVDQLT